MIVQALHVLQGEDGYLSKDRLRDLSRASGIPLYRLHEVASFFPHFRLKEENAEIEVHVCHDQACHLAGSNAIRERVAKALAAKLGERVKVKPVSCLGRCDRAPAALIENVQLRTRGEEHVEREHLLVSFDANTLYDICMKAAELATPQERQHLLESRASRDSVRKGDRSVNLARWSIDPYAVRGEVQPRWQKYAAVEQLVEAIRREGRPSVELRNQPDEAIAKSYPLLKELSESKLRGMGGAGQPAYEKWRDLWRGEADAKYVVVNADESEPSTFKDREIMLHAPHALLEGVILAGVLCNATRGYIYIRHEYPEEAERMEEAIREAEQLGYCGENASELGGMSFPVEVFISPGGYICGEASALIEAMEDHRAEPRNKPPALEANGLFGKPTLVSNVETFAWVPAIYLNRTENIATAEQRKPPNWYLAAPGGPNQGRRFFSACGDVARPGVYEIPIGISLGLFVNHFCKGMKAVADPTAPNGRRELALKAFASSGPSGGFLPAKMNIADVRKRLERNTKRKDADARAWEVLQTKAEGDFLDIRHMEMEIDFFRVFGADLGAGLCFYADRPEVDMLDQALNCLEFFRNETCGKCVPCRVGSRKLADFLDAVRRGAMSKAEFDDLRKDYDELMKVMGETSICGLGASVPKPLKTLLTAFDDWKKYVK